MPLAQGTPGPEESHFNLVAISVHFGPFVGIVEPRVSPTSFQQRICSREDPYCDIVIGRGLGKLSEVTNQALATVSSQLRRASKAKHAVGEIIGWLWGGMGALLSQAGLVTSHGAEDGWHRPSSNGDGGAASFNTWVKPSAQTQCSSAAQQTADDLRTHHDYGRGTGMGLGSHRCLPHNSATAQCQPRYSPYRPGRKPALSCQYRYRTVWPQAGEVTLGS